MLLQGLPIIIHHFLTYPESKRELFLTVFLHMLIRYKSLSGQNHDLPVLFLSKHDSREHFCGNKK